MNRAIAREVADIRKSENKPLDPRLFEDLCNAIRSCGISPPETLVGDGKMHHFPTNARRTNSAGWYVLRLKAIPTASFGDFRAGVKGSWRGDAGSQLSKREKEIFEKLERLAAQQYAIEFGKEKRAAAERACGIWNKADEPECHPYLKAKKISAHGTRVNATGQLIIPVYIGGEVQSLQFISADRSKKFLKGGAVAGGYFSIGDIHSASIICIAEGFATGASIHEATGLPVAISFNCGNLVEVARAIRATRPVATLVICADDDFKTKLNPGLKHAEEARRAVSGVLAVPTFKARRKVGQTDFNDMAARYGLSEVEKIIRQALADATRGKHGESAVTPVTDVTAVPLSNNGALPPTSQTRANVVEIVSAPNISDSEPPDPFEGHAFAVFQHRFRYLGRWREPGVYWFSVKGKGNKAEPQTTRVCSPLYVEAVTRDHNHSNFGRVLRFRDTLGNWRLWTMPMEWLKGKSDDLFGELLSMGLVFPRKSMELFADYLQTSAPTECKICATQIGWYEDTFVLPTVVIGPQSDNVVFQGGPRQPHEYEQKGSLAEWQSSIAARAVGNPILELAISISLAGPLLQICNAEGGGLHLFGNSSTGKTTALEVAVATWGGPEHKRSWRTTVNGMEAAALLCNDTLLAIDEVSQCNTREVGMIAYGLGNGIGKQRMSRSGSARPVSHFKAAILSSGERSLEATLNASGDKALAGQKLRILDLPVTRQYGAWNELGDFPNGAAFSDALKRAASEHYGHAGPAFLERLTQDKSDLAERLNQIKQLPEFLPLDASGQELRAASRFAIIALAGELATEYGITMWKPGAATDAAAECYATWRNFRGHGTDENHQVIEALTDFIEANGDSRFSYPDKELPTRDRVGWVKDTVTKGRIFMFTAAGMTEALRGMDLRPSLDVLERLSVIPPAHKNGERSRGTKIKGEVHRLYHVNYPKLSTYRLRE